MYSLLDDGVTNELCAVPNLRPHAGHPAVAMLPMTCNVVMTNSPPQAGTL